MASTILDFWGEMSPNVDPISKTFNKSFSILYEMRLIAQIGPVPLLPFLLPRVSVSDEHDWVYMFLVPPDFFSHTSPSASHQQIVVK
jgi:hypothetical protein